MIVLALDPSTKNTGWSIFEDQELKEYGSINAGSTNLFKRIDKMAEGIDELIKKYEVTHVAIEDVLPSDVKENQKVYKALMYLQGFIMHKIDDNNLTNNTVFFTSSEWRKKCGIQTGRGIKRDSLKPKDKQFVKDQFGITVADDIADSIGLGFAAVGGKVQKPQVITDDFGFEFG